MGMIRETGEPDGLEGFHPVVAEWFRTRIGRPSAPQMEAWPEIAAGKNVLVAAPTGSGKTLAAFLESINRLFEAGLRGEMPDGVHVLYVSPLKALNNDISRNLDHPLAEIRAMCADRGIPFPDIRKAVRTGDTPDSERQRMLKKPPHILITTPESLFLMLTSVKASATLRNVRYLILDEIHALIGSKRGAHLSLSVERLAAMVPPGLVRIGLSATVQPLDVAALFLGGLSPGGEANPVCLVAPPMEKPKDLRIEMPVADFRALEAGSIWPDIYDTVLRLVKNHTATIVFVNNRAVAEKVAANVNDMADAEICIPHHGSLSKERRFEIEARFKSGDIRCMVATATLELGIDVGQVDLMIQIATPISIAGGLQRLGRAGHRLDAISRGRIIPKTRGDLLKASFVAREMMAGRIESSRLPREPLDVLAQHLVSMACGGRQEEPSILGVIRRSASYRDFRESDLRRVLSMLAGDYEHREDIPAKPRLSWDRIHHTVEGTPYSRMLAISAGGTIPDRGMFPVVLSDGRTRVGELDEEYVFESRQGDVFMLGNSPWRMDLIDRNRVTVSPAPSARGAETPFWKGDGLGMPYAQGIRFGAYLREMEKHMENGVLVPWLMDGGVMGEAAAMNLQQYLSDQRDATSVLPHDRRIVVETLADGDAGVSVIIHAHFGGRVNATIEALLRQAVEETLRISTYSTHTDEIILLYLYGVPDEVPPLFSLLSSDRVEETLLRVLPGTSRFSISFRYNAYRALMMGTRKHGSRLPLWIQRLRSVEAMDQARRSADHPLMIETMRECMEDAFDIRNTKMVLDDLAAGRISVVPVTSWYPSPFASEVLFQFESVMLYATNEAHPGGIRAPVVSGMDALHLENLKPDHPTLDPAAVLAIVMENRVAPKFLAADSTNAVHSLLLMHGDLSSGDLADCMVSDGGLSAVGRVESDLTGSGEDGLTGGGEDGFTGDSHMGDEPERYRILLSRLAELVASNRALEGFHPVHRWIAMEEAELYQAAETDLAANVEENAWAREKTGDTWTREDAGDNWTREEACLRILRRYARYGSPFTEIGVHARYAMPAGTIHRLMDQLEGEGFLVRGSFTLPGIVEWCHRIVWERIRYRSLRDASAGVRSRPASDYAAWLPEFQHVGHPSAKPSDRLMTVIRQLSGMPLPAEWWESIVFPARIPGYQPGLLDRLCAAGRVCWRVLPASDTKGMMLAFFDPEEIQPNASACPDEIPTGVASNPEMIRAGANGSISAVEISSDLTEDERATWQVLGERGACFTHQLTSATKQPVSRLMESLSGLTAKGLVANDSFAPVRFILEWRKSKDPSAFTRRMALMTAKMEMGRWERVSVPPVSSSDVSIDKWFARYGIACREVAEAEGTLGWADAYPVLKNREFAGKAARGLFFEGMSGIQFLPGNTVPAPAESPDWRVLIACDPAQAYGRIIPHAASGISFSRVPGTVVVMKDGIPVLSVERSGSGFQTTLYRDGLSAALSQLARAFLEKRIWPSERKLAIVLLAGAGMATAGLAGAGMAGAGMAGAGMATAGLAGAGMATAGLAGAELRNMLQACGFETEVNRMVLRHP